MVYGAVITAGVGFLIMCGVAAWTIWHGHVINEQLCDVIEENRKILTDVVDKREQQLLERSRSVEQQTTIILDFNELRLLIPPLRCTDQGGPVELEPSPSPS